MMITHPQLVSALAKDGATIAAEITAADAHILHMAIGISGESGELLDAIKNQVIYRKPLDRENVIEELGDLEFYMEGMRQGLGITREQCLAANIAKLQKRYQNSTYSDQSAQERADKVGDKSNLTEIKMIGWHKDQKIWLLGDCAVTEGGEFIFPDSNGIIWNGEQGYYFDNNNHNNFFVKPPILFPGLSPNEAMKEYAEIDWKNEQGQCALVFNGAMNLFYASYGNISGYLHIGGIMSFLAHPELLQTREGVKTSVWVQGARGCGKTATQRMAQMLLGFSWDSSCYLNGTNAGIWRLLKQYSCLPLHFDEWKNKEASDALVSLVRSCFMQQTAAKGVKDNSRNTRQVTPMTVPIVTGEDSTIDAATESRFINLTMSSRNRTDYINANMPNTDAAKVFSEITELSTEFYRIGRFLFKHRETYVMSFFKWIKCIQENSEMNAIADARTKFSYSCAIASFIAVKETLGISHNEENSNYYAKEIIKIAIELQ